jgi:N6-adenosine-specific RNA methylase IME4
MIPFPDKKYQIIYADPPWSFNQKVGIFQDGGRGDRLTCNEYPCMQIEDMMALPVSGISDDDCALFILNRQGK